MTPRTNNNTTNAMTMFFLHLSLYSLIPQISDCFTIVPDTTKHSITTMKTTTTLYLEDHVADMIDMELLRLHDEQEYKKQTKMPSKEPVLLKVLNDHTYNDDNDNNNNNNVISMINDEDVIGKRKDLRLLSKNPFQYCADRCVSTGHCEVLEDMFHMSPEEVVTFCKDCVLSDDEEPCDIPEQLFDSENPDFSLRP